jgi:hypothetical protein
MAAHGKYQDFHRVLGEVLDSHPKELAVIKEHLEETRSHS